MGHFPIYRRKPPPGPHWLGFVGRDREARRVTFEVAECRDVDWHTAPDDQGAYVARMGKRTRDLTKAGLRRALADIVRIAAPADWGERRRLDLFQNAYTDLVGKWTRDNFVANCVLGGHSDEAFLFDPIAYVWLINQRMIYVGVRAWVTRMEGP